MKVTEVTGTEIGDLAPRIKNAIERYQVRMGATFKAISEDIGMSTNNLYRIQGGKNDSIGLNQLLNIERVVLFPEDYPINWIRDHDDTESLLMHRSMNDLPFLTRIRKSESDQSEVVEG